MGEVSIKNKSDPRAVRTRKLLVESLMKLMASRPFAEISVQDLAAEATLNRATFYAHFEDKQGLLEYATCESFREVLEKRLELHSSLEPESLKDLILAVCEFLGRLFTHCKSVHLSEDAFDAVEHQVKAQVHSRLLEWLKLARSGSGKAPYSLELAATGASWSIYGISLQWARGPRTQSAEKLVRLVQPMMEALLKAGSKGFD